MMLLEPLLGGDIDASFSLLIQPSSRCAYHCAACGQVLAVPTRDNCCDGGCARDGGEG